MGGTHVWLPLSAFYRNALSPQSESQTDVRSQPFPIRCRSQTDVRYVRISSQCRIGVCGIFPTDGIFVTGGGSWGDQFNKLF
ncbi:MAG: hypothetical protein D6728_14945 [Cyanobacteria bacterium J055]|nr:MAG: hypothetical protein D6728_14945 [Cyanobacteria bacterium J055]